MEPSFEMIGTLPSLWDTLAAERRDIWLYGMGNGADKILTVLGERNIAVRGVFASDGFVRGQVFHGMPVRSFSEVSTLYPPQGCVVLLAFGSARSEVLSLIKGVAERYPLFVPDVPVCGSTLFDAAFFAAHRAELAAAREMLADAQSRRIFDLTVAYKLTGRYDLLMDAADAERRDLLLLRTDSIRSMADLGAYNGDTAREMLSLTPLSFLLAVEPDKRNYKKLCQWAQTVEECRIVCHCAAVYDRMGNAAFDASGNRNAGLCTGNASPESTVPTVTVDGLLAGEHVDYIKYDVEGAEAAALLGTRETLARCAPRLKVACYHRSEDLFALPQLLSTLAPHHKLYLTRRACVPAWDLDIIAIPQ